MTHQMTHQQTTPILLTLIFALVALLLAGCSGVPPQPAPPPSPTAAPLPTAARPTQTRVADTPTATATLVQPSATPTLTATSTSVPTPVPMTVVKAEDGWVTYRNEIVGYEISAPERYQVTGSVPGVGFIGHELLGPAVPDEEIEKLVSAYYGESLIIWMRDTDPSGKPQPWGISIYADDILEKKLGAAIGLGGIGDYELDTATEMVTIDGQSHEITFTVLSKSNQAVQELGVLYLEQGGIKFIFGYFPEKDNPETYQAYRKEVWPVMRRILESYQHLPQN